MEQYEQTSVKFESKYKNFLFKKMYLKCDLLKVSHFLQATGAETRIFRDIYINVMVDAAQVPSGARSSATMFFNMPVLMGPCLPQGSISIPLPSQCWEMITRQTWLKLFKINPAGQELNDQFIKILTKQLPHTLGTCANKYLVKFRTGCMEKWYASLPSNGTSKQSFANTRRTHQ